MCPEESVSYVSGSTLKSSRFRKRPGLFLPFFLINSEYFRHWGENLPDFGFLGHFSNPDDSPDDSTQEDEQSGYSNPQSRFEP